MRSDALIVIDPSAPCPFELLSSPQPLSSTTPARKTISPALPLPKTPVAVLIDPPLPIVIASDALTVMLPEGPWYRVQPVLRACYAASGSPKSVSLAADPG
jgi:hypothetical protein